MEMATGDSPRTGELHIFLDDVEELLSRVMDIDDADIITLRQRVTDSMDAARASLGTTTTRIQDRARLAARTADEYVHRNPWTVLGFVAAVGLIGLLASRR